MYLIIGFLLEQSGLTFPGCFLKIYYEKAKKTIMKILILIFLSVNIYAQDTTFLKIKSVTNAYVSFKTQNGNIMYADWSYLPICNDFIIDENLTYYILEKSKTNKIQTQIYVDFICVKEVEIVEQPIKKDTVKEIKSDTIIIRKVNSNMVFYPHRGGIVKYSCNYKWAMFQPKKAKNKLTNKK